MSNAEIWNLVITIFTFAGFSHYILTRKTRIKKTKRVYQTKKVSITPERAQKIQAQKARKKKGTVLHSNTYKNDFTESYIEACWDEL